MSRPQSGVIPAPLQYNRIQVLEIHDLPMTSMTVGQFSVMIPGLGHQLAQTMPTETLRVVVGFGPMFWTLAWHGNSPRGFRAFEELECDDRSISEGEGDIWIHYSATHPDLITKLARKVDNNLRTLVRVLEDHQVQGDNVRLSDDELPPDIWIPETEADFSRGTFLIQLYLEQDPAYSRHFLNLLQKKLTQAGCVPQVLLKAFISGDEEPAGTLLFLYHRDCAVLDDFLEELLEEPPDIDWSDAGIRSMRATRFFIPSLDILTGLRQGGIRMNRFSQTQQWKD